MNDKKTHWKLCHNPNYIGSYAFQPNEHKILTIKSAGKEIVKNERGQEECLVVHFKSDDKPLICNVTNCKAISLAVNSSYIEDWVNKKIELYTTKIKAFGEIVDAVRVNPKTPVQQKEILIKNSERWNGAVQAIKDKKITIEKIAKLFEITEDDLKELEFQANELEKIEAEENKELENGPA